MTKWILLFVIGIMFESTGLVFLKKGMMTEKGMMTVAEIRPLTVSKALSVVKTAATNGQQATRDGRSSSASRFTLVGPACLSSGR